jgi:oligogalacturonide lyase
VIERITRRAILAALPVGLSAATKPSAKKTPPLPSVGEFFRFADPTTETPVVRLTSPRSTSVFPKATNRFVSLKGRFLIFSSDRTGKMTPFQLDLRTGTLMMLAETADLDTSSLSVDERAKVVHLLDGGKLKEITIANKRVRTLAENISAFSLVGPSEFLVVKQGRLEQLNAQGGVLAEDVNSWCLVRPGRKGCAFDRIGSANETEFWYVSLPNSGSIKPKLLAKGCVSNPFWSPDGQSLLLLRDVEVGSAVLSEIHEVFPETEEERALTRTSQFAAFAPNGDASVFVGASRSKAQPTIVLLIRSVRRELTLCEHRASNPASVHPVFSPDSRRVYFQSDHQGKSALYSVNVELLVEPTPTAL